MNCIGTYDGTIFYNPANKFCIVSVKTADQSVPAEARSNRRYKDHLIRFTAVGYEIPRTDAVELELDGEWTKGKYGVQLQVEQWREIVPRTKNGVEGYLASGLIKGIGPKTAADIVERFGVATLDILEHQPERLLEIRGITENKLEDIRASYAENRMLQGIMTLLAPFKITPKTALKIYQYFGPTSVEILEKSPFELCQISGFGFRRVDAIVQKSGGDLHDPMRIKGAVFCALDEGKSKRGHLYISSEELEKSALKLLNEKIPVPELRLHQQEVRDMMQEMILNGAIVSVKDMLPLQPAHRNHLHSPKRGLSDEQIDRIGFKSTPPPFLCRSITERLMKQGCKVEGVPGFYLDDSGRWTMNFYRKNAGILIPAVGYDGMIHGLQILLDIPLKQKDDPPDKAGAKYIWFSSSSKNMGVTSGSPVHFIGDPSARVVYVIEGLLKADISHCLTNRTFVAIAGANNTSQLDTLFALLAQNGTEEIIEAHDMDKYSNQMTSNGASKIYLMARKNGMACRRLTWNPNYKGFDDWQLALREKEQKEKEVQRMNFKQQYLCGKCDFTYIDGCVELWHTRAEKDLDLTEYLGLTKEEYQIFLAQGNQALKDILDSQRVFRRFCIYQLCLGETQTVPFAFKQLDALRKAGYEQPPAAAYQTVWSAEVCCPKGQNDMEVLGRLFLDYNEHLPEDYRGRPLAPSDVVELDCQGKRTYFYVNDCRDFAPVRFSPFLCKRLPEPAQKQE